MIKAIASLMFAVPYSAAFGQASYQLLDQLSGSGSGSGIGGKAYNITDITGGYSIIVSSGAGGGPGVDYPGSSTWSYSASVQWQLETIADNYSDIPYQKVWATTLPEYSSATATTYGISGTASGSGAADSNTGSANASGSNDNSTDFQPYTYGYFGSTITSPSFTEQSNGTYTNTFTITTDSLSSAASTTHQENATGVGSCQMVVNSVTFTY